MELISVTRIVFLQQRSSFVRYEEICNAVRGGVGPRLLLVYLEFGFRPFLLFSVVESWLLISLGRLKQRLSYLLAAGSRMG